MVSRCIGVMGVASGGTTGRRDADASRLGKDRGYWVGVPDEVATHPDVHGDGDSLMQEMAQ